MAVDKEKNRQVLVTFTNEQLKRIEDYQFENRIPSRTEAIRDLVDKGLESAK
ncbi:hypothetical protein GCM10022378_11320 [Salinicoccus jeotgali]|uniref:Antitoxin MazE n=1 Tax=Salinicoccus jeotgali TaxID=381634 RepID=A0ABP7EQR8_9STAP